jgi:eukaryotic-like serine/threonine-protein kinase
MESPANSVDRASSQSLELAHVLYIDLVGYSLLPTDRQEDVLEKLQETVRDTEEFRHALGRQDLICLSTGDGLALVFFREPEAPVRCAVELSKALRRNPEIKLRMGAHSGPVYRRADINANLNVAGGGINVAQRVMDCGDAGHILVSKAAAEVLSQVGSWSQALHDLGEAEVKHGQRVRVFNLWTDEVGNRERPRRVRWTQVRRVRRAAAAAVTAIVIVGGLSSWLIFGRKAHALGEADTIVLADFENKTGDPVFDDTLKTGLSVALTQSPFLNVLSENKVATALKLMSRPAGTPVISEVAREVCQRTGSRAVIAGSIAGMGSEYVVGLKAVDCQTGDSMARQQVQAAKKEDVLNALDQAASKLRENVGESLSSVRKYDTRLAQATTPSLEALKAFSIGARALNTKGPSAAIPLFQRATELDANFALAYASLGVAYRNLSEFGLANENFQKAFDLSGHVSEREKYTIASLYYSWATGDLEKADQIYELFAQTYPQSAFPKANLGVNFSSLGQYDKAVPEYLESVRLDPDNANAYASLVDDYACLNRLDEAKNAYQMAISHKLDNPYLHYFRYGVAFLEGDVDEMQRQAQFGTGKPEVEGSFLSYRSDTEAFAGHLGKARDLSRQAMDAARSAGETETGVEWKLNAALREAEFGNAAQAHREADAAVALASTRDVRILAALALARAGDSDRAQKIANELQTQNPLNTMINGYFLPTIRAAIEVNRKNPAKAIEMLEVAAPHELGNGSPDPVIGAMMYPVYVRGQAYLLLHQGSAAAAEFQKFVDHRGVVVNCPLGALARLGLARAYALQDDRAKARAAYQEFLTLWKDADPGIPILKQAKAEYAKLQ